MSNCSIPSPGSHSRDLWLRANALDAASRVMSGLVAGNNFAGPTVTDSTLVVAAKFEAYLRNGYNGGQS